MEVRGEQLASGSHSVACVLIPHNGRASTMARSSRLFDILNAVSDLEKNGVGSIAASYSASSRKVPRLVASAPAWRRQTSFHEYESLKVNGRGGPDEPTRHLCVDTTSETPVNFPWDPYERAQERSMNNASNECNWCCRGCGNVDKEQLERNSDGAYVCALCGAVEHGHHVVITNRQKNCAACDDSTITADVSHATPSERFAHALSDSTVETSVQARKRKLESSQVSDAMNNCSLNMLQSHAHVSAQVSTLPSRTLQFSSAQRVVDREMLKGLLKNPNNSKKGDLSKNDNAHFSDDSEVLEKTRRVLRYQLAIVQKVLANFDERVLKFSRIESARIISRGMRHMRCCTSPNCAVMFDKLSNAAIALQCLLTLFGNLLRPVDAHTDTSSEKAPTPLLVQYVALGLHERKIVSAVQALEQISLKGLTVSHVEGASSSVRMLASDHDGLIACTPCAHTDEHLPSINSTMSREVELRSKRASVMALRNSILSSCRSASVSIDSRSKALLVLDSSVFTEWLTVENTLDVNILSLLLLKLASSLNDPKREVLKSLLINEVDKSDTTIDTIQKVTNFLENTLESVCSYKACVSTAGVGTDTSAFNGTGALF